ncbi:MAG: hypothetical protein IKP76_00410 [Bacilli bacterium]|nr:hypothetical protein [Bacilli bacterium]
MKEEKMINETEQTTQPVEQPVQETPIAPVPETTTFEQPVAETPVQPEPVAAPEAPVEPTAVPQEPVATEPVQTNEQPKKKKSILPALIVIIIILALLCGAAYYLFVFNTDNPVFKMFVKENTTTTIETTTTTVAKLTEEEAKKLVLDLYNKHVDDSMLLFNICYYGDTKELDIESSEYEALGLPEGNCNGFYQPIKSYKTLDEVKKHIGEYYSETLTTEIAKKFLVKDDVVYCCVPYTSFPIGNDNLTVNTIEIEATKITATVKYTTGGDEMHELENHEGKIVIEKTNDKWLVSSIE